MAITQAVVILELARAAAVAELVPIRKKSSLSAPIYIRVMF
jgi:hypothetical protein